MTLNDLADAYPGPVSAEADTPGGDTYETSRTSSRSVSPWN